MQCAEIVRNHDRKCQHVIEALSLLSAQLALKALKNKKAIAHRVLVGQAPHPLPLHTHRAATGAAIHEKC